MCSASVHRLASADGSMVSTQFNYTDSIHCRGPDKNGQIFPCTTEHVHQQRQNVSFRDGLQRSNRVWICCCSLMKSWLIMFFYTKFALVRSDDWWVSFTRPWAVFTRLGRPDEWLVRTLNADPIHWRIYVALGGDELMTQFTSYDSRSSENLWMTMNCA